MQPTISTLGQLKASGYEYKSLKTELRQNLIQSYRDDVSPFTGIYGYENTVLPQVERAILAGHSINFLGLRGQAKTKIAHLMTNLLDEWVPYIKGSEIYDDPFQPISTFGKERLNKFQDETEIAWLHHSNRYFEKLATPDVNIADLIGDVDVIKASNQKLSLSDEGAIHYGMIPRANRCLFVLNELPDLQPRIQVALFNILQEGDVQIRGFKVRLPLDIQFIFTANPEDYTNRGSIITPLKDRIQAQIFTHYPTNIDIGRIITRSQVKLNDWQKEHILVPDLIERLIEQITVEARKSDFVDEKSGVSARLPISAYESVVAAVERRMLLNQEERGVARIGDLVSAIPAIVGKIEMVYEGEQEGAANVAYHLINQAIRSLSPDYFPNIDALSKKRNDEIRKKYAHASAWFDAGHSIEMPLDASQTTYKTKLDKIEQLRETVELFDANSTTDELYLLMEYLLHTLSTFSILSKKRMTTSVRFQDYFNSVMHFDRDDLG